MTHERQLRPVGRLPPIENFPGLHEADTIGLASNALLNPRNVI